ncbi:MAG: hypothetical protein Q9228_007759, partial [Teloschistes exilis]
MDNEKSGDLTRSRTRSPCSTKGHESSEDRTGQYLDNHSPVIDDTGVKQTIDEGKESKKARNSSSDGRDNVSNGEPNEDDVEVPLEKKQSTILATDPNLVTWNGPDDLENPKNWSTKHRWAATLVVSSFTLISPVSSSMVAPALPAIAKDLGISSEVESQMVLSIFVLAYAVGPLFLGPLSEVYGRIPVLQITNLVYLVFNTAAGGCKTKEQMIAFRFLSGLGGVAAQVVGGGVLSDCWKAEQRGRAMAIYSLAPLLGPSIGPIAGGFITENTTWRWSFYATSIADVLVWISGLFFLRETYPPKLLHLKAKKLRQETGNQDLHTEYEQPERTLFNLISRSIVRPFRLLGTQPIVQVLAVYMAYIYGLMYLVLSTFPALWADRYHETVGIAGLNYISMGLGFMIGAQVFAPLNDRIYRILKKRNEGAGKPEYRVPTM